MAAWLQTLLHGKREEGILWLDAVNDILSQRRYIIFDIFSTFQTFNIFCIFRFFSLIEKVYFVNQ